MRTFLLVLVLAVASAAAKNQVENHLRRRLTSNIDDERSRRKLWGADEEVQGFETAPFFLGDDKKWDAVLPKIKETLEDLPGDVLNEVKDAFATATDEIAEQFDEASAAIENAVEEKLAGILEPIKAKVVGSIADFQELAEGYKGSGAVLSKITEKAGALVTGEADNHKRVIDGAGGLYEKHIAPNLGRVQEAFKEWRKAHPNPLAPEDIPVVDGIEFDGQKCPRLNTEVRTVPGYIDSSESFKIDSGEIIVVVTNFFIDAYNLVSPFEDISMLGADVADWNTQGKFCGDKNWAILLLANVDVGVNAGWAPHVGISAGGSIGVAAGCDNGYVRMGLVASLDASLDVGVGFHAFGGHQPFSAGFEAKFFFGTEKNGYTAWSNIPGYTMSFSAGLKTSKISGSISAYADIPRDDFALGCPTKTDNFCIDHLEGCFAQQCLSTNKFCPAVSAIPHVQCTSAEVCAENIPTGFEFGSDDWGGLYAVGASFETPAYATGLEFSTGLLSTSIIAEIEIDEAPLSLRPTAAPSTAPSTDPAELQLLEREGSGSSERTTGAQGSNLAACAAPMTVSMLLPVAMLALLKK